MLWNIETLNQLYGFNGNLFFGILYFESQNYNNNIFLEFEVKWNIWKLSRIYKLAVN